MGHRSVTDARANIIPSAQYPDAGATPNAGRAGFWHGSGHAKVNVLLDEPLNIGDRGGDVQGLERLRPCEEWRLRPLVRFTHRCSADGEEMTGRRQKPLEHEPLKLDLLHAAPSSTEHPVKDGTLALAGGVLAFPALELRLYAEGARARDEDDDVGLDVERPLEATEVPKRLGLPFEPLRQGVFPVSNLRPVEKALGQGLDEYANRHYRTQDNGQNEGSGMTARGPSHEMRIDRQ